ncbi:MAG: cellulose biosynthesis cyclic di-GMP-binding regulatory protein BcsB [Sulfuricella sp.]
MLAPYLQGLGIPAHSGPLLAVRPWPGNPNHYLVLITGDDPAQVRQAAQVFALASLPLPAQSWVAITHLHIPLTSSLQEPLATQAADKRAYSLLATGFHTTTFTGYQPRPAQIRILNGGWQRKAQVRLHLTYAAGMAAAQSALNVVVNGSLTGSIPLNNPAGEYSNYTVTIPTTVLHPGWNILELQLVLIPVSNGGECKPFFMGNLALTVYDDSTFEWMGGIPSDTHDLATLADSGAPYTQAALGNDLVVQLLQSDPATLSAGLTLISKIAQVAHRPLLGMWFGSGTPPHGGRIVLGTLAGLPKDLRQSLGINPNVLQVAYPVGMEAGEESLLSQLGWGEPTMQRPAFGNATLRGDFSHLAFAASGRIADKVVTVFTADNPSLLASAMDSLVGYGHWAQLRGTLDWWTPDGKTVTAVGLDETPFRSYGLRGGASLWISRYPWLALLIIVAVGLAFVILTRFLLRRYERKHHGVG